MIDYQDQFKIYEDQAEDMWAEGLPHGFGAVNSATTWVPSDSFENFIKAKERFERETKTPYPWSPESFNYTLNDHGYRGPHFNGNYNNKFVIMTVGCSFTAGIGIPYNSTWPEVLAAMIPNAVSLNFGYGGASYDYCVRVIYKSLRIIKPSLVCVLAPPISRHEVSVPSTENETGSTIISILPNYDTYEYIYKYSEHLSNEVFMHYQFKKNSRMISSFCALNNVPLIIRRSETILPEFLPDQFLKGDLARDGLHPGPRWQNEIAKYFYKAHMSKNYVY